MQPAVKSFDADAKWRRRRLAARSWPLINSTGNAPRPDTTTQHLTQKHVYAFLHGGPPSRLGRVMRQAVLGEARIGGNDAKLSNSPVGQRTRQETFALKRLHFLAGSWQNTGKNTARVCWQSSHDVGDGTGTAYSRGYMRKARVEHTCRWVKTEGSSEKATSNLRLTLLVLKHLYDSSAFSFLARVGQAKNRSKKVTRLSGW